MTYIRNAEAEGSSPFTSTKELKREPSSFETPSKGSWIPWAASKAWTTSSATKAAMGSDMRPPTTPSASMSNPSQHAWFIRRRSPGPP